MSERVLVVEDDRELRSFLIEMLEVSGYEAVACASAEAALREIDRQRSTS